MNWLQLTCHSPPALAELMSELMFNAGAASVTLLDAGDQPLFEPAPGSTPLWHATRVVGLFTGDTELESIRQGLSEQFEALSGQPAPPLRIEILEDKDWQREWQKHFKPLQFADRFWIVPSWLKPVDPHAINMLLDPGLAFGTGTHPTTALCLRWLADQPYQAGQRIIDYGCGSGILAIAMLLLGAEQVVGVDNDPQALQATTENAARNGLGNDRLTVYLPDDLPAMQADLIVANILTRPLISLASHFAGLLQPSGLLTVSGVLARQREELVAAYKPWFNVLDEAEDDGWIRLTFRRHHAL